MFKMHELASAFFTLQKTIEDERTLIDDSPGANSPINAEHLNAALMTNGR